MVLQFQLLIKRTHLVLPIFDGIWNLILQPPRWPGERNRFFGTVEMVGPGEKDGWR